MFRFQNSFVFLLGIIISFILFGQTLKSNQEYQALESARSDCLYYKLIKMTGFTESSCRFYLSEMIQQRYGVSEEDLRSKKNRQIIFYTLPVVCLIVPLFVVFAANQSEVGLSFFSIMPLNLWLVGSEEAWLIGVFIIFIPTLAYIFRRSREKIISRLSRIV